MEQILNILKGQGVEVQEYNWNLEIDKSAF